MIFRENNNNYTLRYVVILLMAFNTTLFLPYGHVINESPLLLTQNNIKRHTKDASSLHNKTIEGASQHFQTIEGAKHVTQNNNNSATSIFRCAVHKAKNSVKPERSTINWEFYQFCFEREFKEAASESDSKSNAEIGKFTFFVSQITHVHLLKKMSHVHSRS